MISSLPKFRTDLRISRQETDEGPIFVVKDPQSAQYYRFREAEQFIVQQLDGQTGPDVVRERTEARFGAELHPQALSAFLKNLEKSGLLENGTPRPQRKKFLGGRLAGNLLYIQFRVVDPSRLFERLSPHTWFFYTRQFLVISAMLIVLALMITAFNWGVYLEELPRLYTPAVILPFLFVVFAVVSGHEFAHGLTCKHFGGDVHEMGLMLVYFQPAFYCNVSDAWLFPEKSKRLWVGFAGPYFELFLWSLAVIVWRLTDPEVWIHDVSLIVMTGSGIKTFINFNPFIKLDGYYLLSDYLEIPNLRRKSFRYVGTLIRRAVGVVSPPVNARSVRERRIFLMYGLVASIGSFSLLGYILFNAGSYILEGRQPVAVALMVGLIAMKFRRRIFRLFGARSKSAGAGSAADPDGLDDGEDFETPASSDEPEGGSREPSQPKKKQPRRSKRRKVLLALAVVVLAIVVFGKLELKVSGPFNILAVHNADVRSEIDGFIASVLVTEGDAVHQGDILAQLSDRENRSELQKTEEEIRQSRAKLRLLVAGPTQEEIELGKTGVQKAQEHLNFARGRLDRDKLMFQRDLISKKQLEDTEELEAIAEQDLAEAEGKMAVLVKGARPEEVEGLRAEISRLEVQQRYLQGQLERSKVYSPTTGIIGTPARQLKEMVGQSILKGALIAKVLDFKTLTVEIAVPEKDIAEVKVGEQVVLKARAYPDETFTGQVTAIATMAQAPVSGSSSSGKTILVSTEIDNRSMLLRPEMTGNAKILCGQRHISELLLRRLAHTLKVEFWSWW